MDQMYDIQRAFSIRAITPRRNIVNPYFLIMTRIRIIIKK